MQNQTVSSFSQVSGLSFVFDPEKPPGERVLKDTVMVYDRIPISLEQVRDTVFLTI